MKIKGFVIYLRQFDKFLGILLSYQDAVNKVYFTEINFILVHQRIIPIFKMDGVSQRADFIGKLGYDFLWSDT